MKKVYVLAQEVLMSYITLSTYGSMIRGVMNVLQETQEGDKKFYETKGFLHIWEQFVAPSWELSQRSLLLLLPQEEISSETVARQVQHILSEFELDELSEEDAIEQLRVVRDKITPLALSEQVEGIMQTLH